MSGMEGGYGRGANWEGGGGQERPSLEGEARAYRAAFPVVVARSNAHLVLVLSHSCMSRSNRAHLHAGGGGRGMGGDKKRTSSVGERSGWGVGEDEEPTDGRLVGVNNARRPRQPGNSVNQSDGPAFVRPGRQTVSQSIVVRFVGWSVRGSHHYTNEVSRDVFIHFLFRIRP